MEILIVGGGIGGLSLALALDHAKLGAGVKVCEAATSFLPLGVGINLLPHAMNALTTLGVADALAKVAVEPKEFAYFTHHGQHVLSEPCGLNGGYAMRHLSAHRGDLHSVLHDAVCERLRCDAVVLDHRCVGVDQDADGAVAHFVDHEGRRLPDRRADIIVACDGIHSAVRKQFYPAEGAPAFHGINMWRGVTRAKPFLTGASVTRIGGLFTTNKLLFYPIRNDIDGEGTQLVNWSVEVVTDQHEPADWHRRGRLEDFYPIFHDWSFDWLDAAAMLRNAEFILTYPMVDRDPVDRFAFGRIALLGDAAHPMYPRGGNGGAQAILDAMTIARLLKAGGDPVAALKAYEAERVGPTMRIVLENRTRPPDLIIDTVERLTSGKRFERLDDVISREELQAISDSYKKVAGWDVAAVARGR